MAKKKFNEHQTRQRHAREDVDLLMSGGAMSMHDTKYGLIHLWYSNGVFTVTNNTYVPSKSEYETIFVGDKQGVTNFISDAYIIEYGRGGFMYEVEKVGGSRDMKDTMFTAKNVTELKKQIIEKYGSLKGVSARRRAPQGFYWSIKLENGGGVGATNNFNYSIGGL